MTMTMKRLDYEYYEWLTSQIKIPNDKTYNDLFERMHNLDFIWTVPNDDNRVQDGKDLRYEFAESQAIRLKLEGTTLLEVLVSLSRRCAFTGGGDPEVWAWRLLKNLRLTKMSDPLTEDNLRRIEDILEALIWRTYDRNGQGGFFPLKQALEDQTHVEIWYQMNAYINEMTDL
jgi:hypothetical protein